MEQLNEQRAREKRALSPDFEDLPEEFRASDVEVNRHRAAVWASFCADEASQPITEHDIAMYETEYKNKFSSRHTSQPKSLYE